MIAYYNSTIRHHNGILGMYARFLALYFQQFGLVAVFSIVSLGACAFMFTKIVREQMAEHGRPTSRLSVGMNSPRRQPSSDGPIWGSKKAM